MESSQTEKQVFLARKGQALIWCAYLLHGGENILDTTRTRWSQVTHYFFEDCAYYTPLSSHLIAGKISFRRPNNIATSETVAPRYSSVPLPEKFVDSMQKSMILANGEVVPRKQPPALSKRLWGAAKKLRGKSEFKD